MTMTTTLGMHKDADRDDTRVHLQHGLQQVAQIHWCQGCGMQDSVELMSVQLHGSPFTDAEDVLPTCYRCGSSNPLVNPQV